MAVESKERKGKHKRFFLQRRSERSGRGGLQASVENEGEGEEVARQRLNRAVQGKRALGNGMNTLHIIAGKR